MEDLIVTVGADITGFLSKIDAAKSKVGQLTESQGDLKAVINDLNTSLRLNEKELTTAAVNLQKLNTSSVDGKNAAADLSNKISQLAGNSKTLSTDLALAKTQLAATTTELKAQTAAASLSERGQNQLNRAIGNVTNVSSIAAREVNNFSRRLISMGGAFVFGAIVEGVAAIGSFISAITEASSVSGALRAAQAALNVAMAEARGSVAGEVVELKSLVSIAKDTSLSYEARTQAIKELNKEYPDLHANITLENVNTDKVTLAINHEIEAIKRRAQAKSLEKLIDEESALLEKTKAEGLAGQVSGFDNFLNKTAELAGAPGLFDNTDTEFNDFKTIINNATAKIDVYSKKLNDLNTDAAKAGDLFVFSKPGKKAAETISDVLAKLARQIAVLNTEQLVFHTDEAQKKISDIEAAITHLIDKFKLTAASPVIIDLVAQVEDLKLQEQFKQEFKTLHLAPIPIPFDILSGLEAEATRLKEAYKTQFAPALQAEVKQAGLNISPFANSSDIDRMFQEAELAGHGAGKKFMNGLSAADFKVFFDKTQRLFSTEGQILSSTLVSALSGIGDDIGKAIDGGSFQNLFGDLFKTIGAGLQEFGKALIEYGIGLKVLKQAFKDPVTAIVAGIGLEILGSIIQNAVPKFASGGFVSGPGTSTSDSINARLSSGEYVINANSVSQYGKSFFDMINGGTQPRSNNSNNFATGGMVSGSIGGGQLITVEVVGNIRGNDIYIANSRAALKLGRNG